MKESERLEGVELGDSYLMLYEDTSKNVATFIIEPFDIPNVTKLANDPTVIGKKNSYLSKSDPSDDRIPKKVNEHFRLMDSMQMYCFNINKSGFPSMITALDAGGIDDTYIFSGYDRNSFAYCPFNQDREDHEYYDNWIPREHAEYDRTALWCSCRFLKEYIDTFSQNNIKRKASLVISSSNWAGKTKQHIPEDLKEHDYWTYNDQNHVKETEHILGKDGLSEEQYSMLQSRKPSIKEQFIHDLLADYAAYLREWIFYIDSFSDDISDVENDDIYLEKEVWEHELDKELSDDKQEFMKKHRGKKNRRKREKYIQIDPRETPDFIDIDILKRIDWLCEYIDFKGDNNRHSLLWQIYDDIKDIAGLLRKFDDKYFSSTTFEIPIVDMYTHRNKPLVDTLFERMEQYRPDDTGIFTKELLPYHFSYISSGEFQFAKVLGGIEEYCVRLKMGDPRSNEEFRPNVIYLLDEPETYMHPELCRKFMKQLDMILQERKESTELQVLISTHSPFLLSDCLPTQVTRLDLDEDGYCQIKNGMDKECFGANIQTILSDGFFLDYTIGEYSRQFLQHKWNKLKRMFEKPVLSEAEKIEVKEICNILPHIGDSFIHQEFKKMTDYILQRENK